LIARLLNLISGPTAGTKCPFTMALWWRLGSAWITSQTVRLFPVQFAQTFRSLPKM
jgi:hypothetical protein